MREPQRQNGRRIVEQDIAIDPLTLWQQGPCLPAAGEYDLESALIHEFGHMAGNEHAHGCENSPLRDRAGAGDYWRGPEQWGRVGCARVADEASRADGPPERRFVHRWVRVDGAR